MNWEDLGMVMALMLFKASLLDPPPLLLPLSLSLSLSLVPVD